MRIPPIHARTRRLASRLLALLLAVAAPAAVHADTTTVQAVGTGPSAPIRSFEITADASLGTPTWFCQVVGEPTVAGAVVVTRDGPILRVTTRHALSGAELVIDLETTGAFVVRRIGEQIARFAPAVAGEQAALREGFVALTVDPAWLLLRRALADQNLLAFLAQSSPPANTACLADCDTAFPMPADCSTPQLASQCCAAAANRECCRAICSCDPASTTYATCIAVAQGRLATALLECDWLNFEN